MMLKESDFPTRAVIAMELIHYQKDLRGWGIREGDVRLQVREGGPLGCSWSVRTGDSQYDPDGQGFWGSGMVTTDMTDSEVDNVAEDLIDQAKEHYCQEHGEFQPEERPVKLAHESVGLCSSCGVCQAAMWMDEGEMREALERGEVADEGAFSWSKCDRCGDTLGGQRYAMHGIDEDGSLTHLDVCVDCLQEVAG